MMRNIAPDNIKMSVISSKHIQQEWLQIFASITNISGNHKNPPDCVSGSIFAQNSKINLSL